MAVTWLIFQMRSFNITDCNTTGLFLLQTFLVMANYYFLMDFQNMAIIFMSKLGIAFNL